MADDGGHGQHAHMSNEEREKRRKKQLKRMGKMLAKVWALKGSEGFQEERHATSKEGHVLDLTTIGQKIDTNEYRLGRHGWEDFARDLGGVYNRHVHRETKHTKTAKSHLKDVVGLLERIDKSLADLASKFVPTEVSSQSQKRKASSEDPMDSRIVRKRSSGKSSASNRAEGGGDADLSLKERETKAMEALATFVEENGGSRDQIAGFWSRVTRKPSDRRYDVNFYNPSRRRFRSMVEVGRFLNLIKTDKPAAAKRKASLKRKPQTSREKEAEKKRLRKELDKLRKTHQRATKNLDDFVNAQTESRYPVEDLVLAEDDKQNGKDSVVTRQTCAAARVPGIDGFDDVPQHCIPELLMVWDFLCTFEKALSLEPIALDDFASALTYKPPEVQGDDIQAPPVYLAEAHIGLLKLLFADKTSEDWWWSILESDETENPVIKKDDLGVDEKEEVDEKMPVIKVDMEALLVQEEDPLITQSWLTALENVRNLKTDEGPAIKTAIVTAKNVCANKWVTAYLRTALGVFKSKDEAATKRAVVWLVDNFKDARPDLSNRSVRESRLLQERARVVEEASKQMEKLGKAAPTVKDEDVASDYESVESEDDESDESDDEDEMADKQVNAKEKKKEDEAPQDEGELPASSIPPRPAPTLVDILLPPIKPHHSSEFLNSFTWPQLAGATACRILHRYKRLRNEIDDSLRGVHELPSLTVSRRREREALTASRVLSECFAVIDRQSPAETALEHLCRGGEYLELSTVQRLCVLRLLIEASYDSHRVYEVVDSNFKQRISAMKALDVEERRAKREARENAAAAEKAAREQLAAEARNKFLEEKRAEIRKVNEGSNEFTDEFMESLTDEDIIEFDDDIKADFAALPAPESFNKTEVNKMVVKMQEAAAFESHSLRVLTLEEVMERDKEELKEMEDQLQSLGGDSIDLLEASMDRETSRAIDRLRKNIERHREAALTLPADREAAMELLRDAMADGTIKVLKKALREAKSAKLTGEDETTGGLWALDLMRDAALELENAKQHKRVADAQKDLVAKRNKCFTRNNPLGRDRFRNRFWHFDRDEHSHVWVEVEYVLKENDALPESPQEFVDLVASRESTFIGAKDEEEDFIVNAKSTEKFTRFSRIEYHHSGEVPALATRKWGCHTTEESLRILIKNLDSRGVRELELKTNLKGALEDTAGSGEKQENTKESVAEQAEEDPDLGGGLLASGDEEPFQRAKDAERETPRDGISMEVLDKLSSGIGESVRVRIPVVTGGKDANVATYEAGKIIGWKTRREKVDAEMEFDEEGGEQSSVQFKDAHVWRAATDRGHAYWLTGPELLESLCRFYRTGEKGYYENDASFLSYRNGTGRHCGRAADAPYASSPMAFARMMVRREQELYSMLKYINYDNNWGGKSGARAVWTNSMKDYTFDFHGAREGLLTLENAFFELMAVDPDTLEKEVSGGKEILENPVTRVDIELESIDSKSISGLWNSPESRAVFYEIVNTSKTTGFLALAFDLLCRNTFAYLKVNKLLNIKDPEPSYQPTTRSTRRLNAWQQANQANNW